MKNIKSDVSGLSVSHNSTTKKSSRTTFIKSNSRGRNPNGEPNPVDIHIGNRIRLRRSMLGLSQQKLASLLGLTFQQIQKYERGMNRIGGSRLWDMSQVLEIHINYFFEDMDKSTLFQSPRMYILSESQPQIWNEDERYDSDPMYRETSINLVKAYNKIPNRKLAQNLYDSMVNAAQAVYKVDEEK